MLAETLVPLAMFKPSVPVPLPVPAVTVHEVAGAPPTAVTEVIAGEPPRPPFTRLKFPAATPLTALVNVTVQETELKFVGVACARDGTDASGNGDRRRRGLIVHDRARAAGTGSAS